jgi:ABC-type transporter Mla subunit MlaD
MVLTLAGCGGDEEPSNSEQACDAADEMRTSLGDMRKTLTTNPTADNLSAARDKVEQAKDDLVNAASDVAQERVDAVEDAWDDLAKAVKNIGDTPINQVVSELQPRVQQLGDELNKLVSSLDCESAS